ncbi:MAG: GspMb/PilO family protein [Candidatus Omnitrophota bacterium]
MNLKEKNIYILYIVGVVLGGLAVLKIVFSPFHAKLSSLSRDVILQESRFKKGVSLIENKKAIEDEYKNYASYFSLQGYSDEEAVANFLKEVEKVSRETGLTVLDMKSQKDAETDKFSKQYQIKIKAEANMEELVKFLYKLSESPLLFSVERLILVPKGEDSAVIGVSMTIVGVSFK